MRPRQSETPLVQLAFSFGEVSLSYAEGPANGPPLVLVHGLGRRWQVFQTLIPAWMDDWHIFAIDLRGHGRSSHVKRGYLGIQYAEDVASFLRERIHQPAVLFGHSLGGMVAMWIASHHPSLVRAIILGDNMISAQDFQRGFYPDLFAAVGEIARRGGSLEEIAESLAKIELKLPPSGQKIKIGDMPGHDAAYLRGWAECVQPLDPDTYSMALDPSSQRGWEGEALLDKIKCPTLLLQANPELGGLMSDADVERALGVIPGSQHVRFPALGHSLHITQPEPILREVTRFLDSIRNASRES